MEVSVLYFGAARERVGCSRERLTDLPVDCSAGALMALLSARYPSLVPLVPHLRVAVNREIVGMETRLLPGAEVALIPPVSGGAGWARISHEPLRLDEVVARVSSPERGAVVTFTGQVRAISHGKRVLRLDYEAYTEMAEGVLERICVEAARAHDQAALSIVHRVGTLEPGELAVVMAAASPHRKEAFSVCAQALERLKTEVPIWKKEYTPEGAEWVVPSSHL